MKATIQHGHPVLVTIIVAVYNAERFIHKCVDSLLGQTYPHIEVILVDDGSPDRCGVLCDEYAARDSRVKVIHQPNGGVAVARQTGIDHATGQYVIHADPDDWVEPTMIEELLAKAQETGADMVICDCINERGSRLSYDAQHLPSSPSAHEVRHRLAGGSLYGILWNKLIRRECMGGVRFKEDVTVAEDLLFLMKMLKARDLKISYLPKAFYHHMYNPSSITNNPSPQTIHSVKAILAYITGEDGIHDENVYYSIKGALLMNLFRTRRFAELPTTCPEIHARYIREHRRFHVFAPLASSLALALRGWPRLAYGLCHLCLWLVRVKEAVYH